MFMVLLLAVVADIIKYVVVVNDNDIMYMCIMTRFFTAGQQGYVSLSDCCCSHFPAGWVLPVGLRTVILQTSLIRNIY